MTNLATVVAHRSVALVGNVTLIATALASRVPVALNGLMTHPSASRALGNRADTVSVPLGTASAADDGRTVVHVVTLAISQAAILAVAEATVTFRRSRLVTGNHIRGRSLLLANDTVHDDLSTNQHLRRGSRLVRGQHQSAHHHLIRVLDGTRGLLNVLVISGHCDSMRVGSDFEFEQTFGVERNVGTLYHFFDTS